MILSQSLEGAWRQAADAAMKHGMDTAPRGLKIKELIGEQLLINAPQYRIPLLPHRKFSLAYAFGELAWYLGEHDDLEFIEYYAPSYHKFSDGGVTLHGAYGPRIFKERSGGLSQWQQCLRMLKEDPDTRQAVISIYSPRDCGLKTKDYPCTLSLQFMIRLGKLHLITTMRSNDLWLGTLYDVFCFTALQEFMANQLGLPIGQYFHQVGSLHMYERNWDQTEKVLTDLAGDSAELPLCLIVEDNFVEDLLDFEKGIRVGHVATVKAAMVEMIQAGKVTGMLDLAKLAWGWKRVQQDIHFGEPDRRMLAELLRQALGPVFERCFF